MLSNGRIMDPESGLDIKGNVGSADGKIQYVGERALTGSKEIDVNGMVVLPGFIDLHSHGHGHRPVDVRPARAPALGDSARGGQRDRHRRGREGPAGGGSRTALARRSLISPRPGSTASWLTISYRVSTWSGMVRPERERAGW